MKAVKQVKVKVDTYIRLKKRFTQYEDTMDSIIKDLLDQAEGQKK